MIRIVFCGFGGLAKVTALKKNAKNEIDVIIKPVNFFIGLKNKRRLTAEIVNMFFFVNPDSLFLGSILMEKESF